MFASGSIGRSTPRKIHHEDAAIASLGTQPTAACRTASFVHPVHILKEVWPWPEWHDHRGDLHEPIVAMVGEPLGSCQWREAEVGPIAETRQRLPTSFERVRLVVRKTCRGRLRVHLDTLVAEPRAESLGSLGAVIRETGTPQRLLHN